MMFRSVALFAHVVGMLVLFVGLAFEWLSLESLQRSYPAPAASAIAVLRALPRYMAGAVALIVVSGVYLAARVGVFDLGWVRVSLGSMVGMGILGGPVIRSQMARVLRTRDDDRRGMPSSVRIDASHPLLRASLRTRVAVALAIVYLMVGKPDLGESLLIIVAALAVGAVTSVPLGRTEIEHSA
jgi:uncharacterized membrane protein